MEAESARPASRPDGEADGIPIGEPTPAQLAAPSKILPSLSRCPYCREDVRAERADWVACEGCLARHHTSCWSEHGSCASCHSRAALERRGRRADSRVALYVFVTVIASLAVLLGLRLSIEKTKVNYSPNSLFVDLPVAAHDLHLGDIVTDKDLETRKFPRAILEGLGESYDDAKVVEGSKVVVAEIKQGAVFTQNDFRRAVAAGTASDPSSVLDRDIEIAKTRGLFAYARRLVVGRGDPELTLRRDLSGDLKTAAVDLVEAAHAFAEFGLADESARAKRAAEALYAEETLAVVSKLLEVPAADPVNVTLAKAKLGDVRALIVRWTHDALPVDGIYHLKGGLEEAAQQLDAAGLGEDAGRARQALAALMASKTAAEVLEALGPAGRER